MNVNHHSRAAATGRALQAAPTASLLLQDRIGWGVPLKFSIVGLLVFGLGYSLLGAGLGRTAFPDQAAGSLVQREGKVVGSRLLAQPFADARYFQPRPSAAGYDPMAAGGSNQARSNPELIERVNAATTAVAVRENIPASQVPADLVTQSGGGLDPHISPGGARVQVARVAQARGMSAGQVQALVARHTQPALFGLVGAARVNVLELNLALDAVAR